MEYEELSDDSKDVIKSMVEFCINRGYRMGMDEGVACFDSGIKHQFRNELESFCGYQDD